MAIVLPARGLADASSSDVALEELSGFAAERLRGDAPQLPEQVELEHEVIAGEQTIGYVLALRASSNGLPALAVDREEVLRTAALAALAEVAVAEARDEVADELRGSLLEDLRSRARRGLGNRPPRRAARLRPVARRGRRGRRGALVAPAPRGGVDLERARGRDRRAARGPDLRHPARRAEATTRPSAPRPRRAPWRAAFARTGRPPTPPSAQAPASSDARSPRRS